MRSVVLQVGVLVHTRHGMNVPGISAPMARKELKLSYWVWNAVRA